MTAVEARPTQSSELLTGSPQVNLLPPEVRSARTLRSLKRYLAYGLGVVALGCVGAVGLATMNQSNAEDALAAEQQRTADLQVKIASYSEVPLVEASLERAHSAQELGMATDMLFADRVGAIAAVLPNDMKIEMFDLSMPSVLDAAVASDNPLRPDPTGTVSLVLRSTTLPDTAQLMNNLDAIPGYESAWVQSVETADDEGTAFYRIEMSLLINTDAYSNRFTADAAQEGEG